jgi:tetratricopeptide (TPR) repeat protein
MTRVVDGGCSKVISASEEYYNLGNYSRRISTKSKDTQEWFNRGLLWCYAFHHKEAVVCFEQAIAHDPACAIAYWGLALALGPNYNKPWELFDEDDLKKTLARIHDATRHAKEHINNASPSEQGLINAIQHRYPEDSSRNYAAWNTAYADAMKPVYENFKDDLDVASLYVDAMMNLTPWEMWILETGKPNPQARTLECKDVLDHAFSTNEAAYKHPHILHAYVHLLEMSPNPERAMAAGEHLRELSPDAGHLCHMPSHLDILVGDYRRAIASNYTAVIADEKYVKKAGGNDYYAFYRLHNYSSLIYAAMFAGQSKVIHIKNGKN